MKDQPSGTNSCFDFPDFVTKALIISSEYILNHLVVLKPPVDENFDIFDT